MSDEDRNDESSFKNQETVDTKLENSDDNKITKSGLQSR